MWHKGVPQPAVSHTFPQYETLNSSSTVASQPSSHQSWEVPIATQFNKISRNYEITSQISTCSPSAPSLCLWLCCTTNELCGNAHFCHIKDPARFWVHFKLEIYVMVSIGCFCLNMRHLFESASIECGKWDLFGLEWKRGRFEKGRNFKGREMAFPVACMYYTAASAIC